MTKKQAIDKELYIVSGTKQAQIGQIDKGLGTKRHTLGQNGTLFVYSIALYYYLSYSSIYKRSI